MKFESSLKTKYIETIKPELLKELDIDNVMAVPKIEKIVVNSGVGEAKNNSSYLDDMVKDVTMITGQKPITTNARIAVSNFKIREGQPIGLKVTLRDIKMWFFLEKMIDVVLPRVKDFRGMSRKSFDGNGNYNFGMSDQLVFPEIDSSKVTRPQGLQITVSTTATSDDDARRLLELLGFPFIKVK